MKVYTKEEVAQKLEKYDAWLIDEESGKLVAGFEFDNYAEAVGFLNEVADIAEELGHHPDILVHNYKFVTVFTNTEDQEGITDKDFELIAQIEEELMAEIEEE